MRRSIPASAGEPPDNFIYTWVNRVYPRECGGTLRHQPLLLGFDGLSPRVRGNLGARPPCRWKRGSIPASAGEPPALRLPRRPRRVYPRECGGTILSCCPEQFGHGLSPRVRGNPVVLSSSLAVAGSIPASAGEPPLLLAEDARPKVYPRECGGTFMTNIRPIAKPGLSPRVRGNHLLRLKTRSGQGSIPASAGEPSLRAKGCGIGLVYPRECGGTTLPISSWH